MTTYKTKVVSFHKLKAVK